MTRLINVFTLLVCYLVVTVETNAALNLVTQDRSVYGYASATDDSGSDQDSGTLAAPDFGPFQEGIGFTITVPNSQGAGSATQNSEILPTGFSIHGSAAASAEGYDPDGFAEGNGRSTFEVVFELSDPTPFSLNGSLAAYDNGGAILQIYQNGAHYLTLQPDYNEETPVSESEILAAGSYTLTVRATASAFGNWSFYDYGFGSFDIDVQFETTTPVGDGMVTGPAHLAVAPNPFSSTTSISYRLTTTAPVKMTVYDLRGRHIRELARSAGLVGTISWDSRDDSGRQVPPGVYFLRFESADQIEQAKITLLR